MHQRDPSGRPIAITMRNGTVVDLFTSDGEEFRGPRVRPCFSPPGGYTIIDRDIAGQPMRFDFTTSREVERWCSERGIACEVREDGSVCITPPKVEPIVTWTVSSTIDRVPVRERRPKPPGRRRWRPYR